MALTNSINADQLLRTDSSVQFASVTIPGLDGVVYASSGVLGALTPVNNAILQTNGSGVPAFSTTLPSAVQANITQVGTIATGVWNGSIIDFGYGGTGQTSYVDGQLLIGNTATGGLSKNTLTAGSGVSITNGNGTISIAISGGGGAVTSVTGTADQVLVNGTTGSPQAGALTLTLPQSINVTSSPTFTKLGIGAGPLYPLDIIVSGTYPIGSEFLGTMTGQTGNKASLFYLGATISPSASLTTAYAIRNETIFNTTSAVITNAYGNYNAPTKTGAGSLTSFYNGYFASVSGASTVNVALYADNFSIGYAVTPPSLSAIISGQLGLGTSSPDSNAKLHSVFTGGNNIYLTGTQTSKDSVFRQSGVLVENIFNPSGGTGGVLAAFNASAEFRTAGGQVSSTAAGLYVNNTTSSLFGDIQIVAGIYVEQGSNDGGVGLRYNNYGAFIKRPLAAGVNGTIALYTDDVAIGTSYYNITPPTSGAIIAGNVSIGTSSNVNKLDVAAGIAIGTYAAVNTAPTNGAIISGPFGSGTSSVNASAQMHVSSTTKGFLTTVMTTTQKNAISSPATLLEVGDSTLSSPFWYNGSQWTNYNLTFATVDPWTAAFCGAA
jgi:hypothetical protein